MQRDCMTVTMVHTLTRESVNTEVGVQVQLRALSKVFKPPVLYVLLMLLQHGVTLFI
jgi:hypothetical protein